MSDELIQTQIVATGPEVKVDEPPVVSPELQAEMDRLTDLKKQAKDAEEKAVYWRKQKAEARADFFTRREEKPPVVEPETQEVGPAPRKEDFDDYDKYVEAVADHRANVKVAKWQKDEEKKQQQTEYQRKITGLHEKLDQGYKDYPDFEEVAMDKSVPITPVVVDIMTETENPAAIAYYLGKNRTEAIRLSRMTPFAAAREIARIEMEIAKTPIQPKIITGAPPPINPLGGGNSLPQKDPTQMSQKEYEEWAKQKGMRRF